MYQNEARITVVKQNKFHFSILVALVSFTSTYVILSFPAITFALNSYLFKEILRKNSILFYSL